MRGGMTVGVRAVKLAIQLQSRFGECMRDVGFTGRSKFLVWRKEMFRRAFTTFGRGRSVRKEVPYGSFDIHK